MTVALALLFASLPGPWLTLGLPADSFALLDRRVAARAAVVVVALVAAPRIGSTIGGVLLGVGRG
jgi:hypothetical protein